MTQSVPTLAVVLPARGGPDGLSAAVRSVAAQIRSPDRLLVVVDPATSRIDPERLREVAGPVEVEVIGLDSAAGGNAARNAGVRAAHTDWVAFLDDDDLFGSAKIAELREAIGRAPTVDVLHHPARIVLPDRRLEYISAPMDLATLPDAFTELLIGDVIGGTSLVAMRSEVVARAGWFDESLPALQGYDLWLRAARIGAEFRLIDSALTTHHVRVPGSADASALLRRYWAALAAIEAKHADEYARLSQRQRIAHRLWALNAATHLALLAGDRAAARSLQREVLRVSRSPKTIATATATLLGPRVAFALRARLDKGPTSRARDLGVVEAPARESTSGAGESLPPFSLLFPVYHRDDPDHVRRALVSTVDEQTLAPDDVVIVVDGPIPEPLDEVLGQWQAEARVPVRIIRLPENVGLGRALRVGLDACRHDVIARMDADDVSRPGRFAAELPLIAAGADVVGSALQEFEGEDSEPGLVRTPPLDNIDILRAARFYQPVNHPTVVYRRRAVLRAGGYQDLPGLEDYWLFARMIMSGSRFANVATPELLYRVGAGAYARRGGSSMFSSEIELQRRFRRIGFTTSGQAARNLLIRGGYRLIPEGVRRLLYTTWTQRRGR